METVLVGTVVIGSKQPQFLIALRKGQPSLVDWFDRTKDITL